MIRKASGRDINELNCLSGKSILSKLTARGASIVHLITKFLVDIYHVRLSEPAVAYALYQVVIARVAPSSIRKSGRDSNGRLGLVPKCCVGLCQSVNHLCCPLGPPEGLPLHPFDPQDEASISLESMHIWFG